MNGSRGMIPSLKQIGMLVEPRTYRSQIGCPAARYRLQPRIATLLERVLS